MLSLSLYLQEGLCHQCSVDVTCCNSVNNNWKL